MEFIQLINNIVSVLNNYLWGYILIIVLLATGFYFTFKIRFSQITMLKHAFTLVAKKDEDKEHHVSSFQAFCTSMASVVGVGSIAGMAVAISLGGPGAIFWLWIIAFVGMATSLVEHTLGQTYKEKYKNKNENIFVGGASYYIKRGLNNKYMACVFSVIIVITYGLVFNSVQSNTIGASLHNAFNIPTAATGIVLAVLTAVIIIGGIKRITKVAAIIVPIMGACYLIIILLVVSINIKEIPTIFLTIFKSAFGFSEVAGGAISYIFMKAISVGIQRAIFSTEAGLGSTPNITACAFVKHPTRQGLVGMLGVFFVAFIICTGTAIIILSSNLYITDTSIQGIALTQASLKGSLGSISVYILVLAIFVFGFTSIIGNYSYAEHNLFFVHAKTWVLYLLKAAVILIIFLGSVASLQFVWNLADLFMAIMILVNIWAILSLSKVAIAVILDYKKQLQTSKEPIFKKESLPLLKNDKESVW